MIQGTNRDHVTLLEHLHPSRNQPPSGHHNAQVTHGQLHHQLHTSACSLDIRRGGEGRERGTRRTLLLTIYVYDKRRDGR